MRAFLDRWLPIEERATVLWLAIGGAVVLLVDGLLHSMTLDRMRFGAEAIPATAQGAVAAAVVFAVTVALVGVAIRWLGAPKSLALFLIVTGLAEAAAVLIGLPFGWLQRTAFEVSHRGGTPSFLATFGLRIAEPLALIVGAVGGALVAGYVTLDRIRDTGLDDEDDDAIPVENAPLGRTLLSMIGWESAERPDGSRVVWALCAFQVIIMVAAAITGGLLGLLTEFAQSSAQVGDVLPRLIIPLSTLGGAAVAFAAALAVFRRYRVRGTWMLLVASGVSGLLRAVFYFIVSRSGSPGPLGTEAVQWLFSSLLPLLLASAALVGGAFAGVMYAESRTVATLDTSGALDAPESTDSPDDTTGGTDG